MNRPASPELVVVAGEASGDRAAAGVLYALGAVIGREVRAFGLGGEACRGAGLELTCDLADSTAMGFGEVAARAFAIQRAFVRLLRETHRRRPRAAMLVGYTEFNARIAAWLHPRGVRVLWYGAPQIWAWRPERARHLRRVIDRLAVVLPFEEKIWRSWGVDARYVGHPAREWAKVGRQAARERLGLTPYAPCVALLPGSRPHEVSDLLAPMLEAYRTLVAERGSVDARLFLAPSLDASARRDAKEKAKRASVEVVDTDPIRGLHGALEAFDVALVASGTATLEATLARAVPITVYRVGAVAELLLRRVLSTRYIALPNVLLHREAFPERVQHDVEPIGLARLLGDVIDRRAEFLEACDEVERALGDARNPSGEVARMLAPWLAGAGDR